MIQRYMIEIMAAIRGNTDCRTMYWCNTHKIRRHTTECTCFVGECSGAVRLALYPKTVSLQYVNSGFPSGGPFITFLIKSEIATSVISNKYIGCVMRYSF